MTLVAHPGLATFAGETLAAKAMVTEHADRVDVSVRGAVDEVTLWMKLVVPSDATIEKSLSVESLHVGATARVHVPHFVRLDQMSPARRVRITVSGRAAARPIHAARAAPAREW
jgi:hypothetical protein